MNIKDAAFDVLGVALQWKLKSSDTGGQYCVLEAVVPPGVMVPPHQHVEQEAFFVLEGTGEFGTMGSEGFAWTGVSAGEMINIPSDSVHGFRNFGTANMRCLITGHPSIQNFFLEAGTPLPNANAIPGAPSLAEIERVLAIATRHGQRFLPPQA